MTPCPFREGDGKGETLGEAARARRQGRPLAVRPLHVVAGFFESDRGSKDSGVRPEKLILKSRSGMVIGYDPVHVWKFTMQ
jgi:hypothetical protein